MAIGAGALEDLGMTLRSWNGRRVLVTGHTGFKGAWLCLWLHELGAEVSGYALAPETTPSLYGDARLNDLLANEAIADVRDAERLSAFARKVQPDAVFHLAAQSLVRRSYAEPARTYTTNLTGTCNLLEAVRHCPGIRAGVIVTTDKCYQNQELARGYTEDDALGGADPYSGSKASAELLTTAYRVSFFGASPAIATARAGNVIGGGDWSEERLMTDLIDAFVRNHSIQLRYPQAVRPWQHVLDALHGYLLLGEALVQHGQSFAQAWNFGPSDGKGRTVAWIAETAARVWGDVPKWIPAPGDQPHESKLLTLDSAKARNRLLWNPVLSVEDAVAWSITWYRAHAANHDRAQALCRDQVRQFTARIAA